MESSSVFCNEEVKNITVWETKITTTKKVASVLFFRRQMAHLHNTPLPALPLKNHEK